MRLYPCGNPTCPNASHYSPTCPNARTIVAGHLQQKAPAAGSTQSAEIPSVMHLVPASELPDSEPVDPVEFHGDRKAAVREYNAERRGPYRLWTSTLTREQLQEALARVPALGLNGYAAAVTAGAIQDEIRRRDHGVGPCVRTSPVVAPPPPPGVPTVTVYRVEHSVDGLGPYRSSSLEPGTPTRADARADKLAERMARSHTGTLNHPSPTEDGIQFDSGDLVCGFDSLRQLNRWFTNREQEQLADAGYVVRVYEVDERQVRRGRSQVMFPLGQRPDA